MSFLATGGKAEVKFYCVSKTGGCRRQLRVNQHDFLHSHSGRTETFLQRKQAGTAGNDAEGLGMRDNSGYQSFSTNFKMILRSGREKPYGVPPYRRGPMRRKFLPSTRSAAAENSDLQLRQTLRCYIQTEDSKTVHFNLDEWGRHEISTMDSQGPADTAWLSLFTSKEPAVRAKTNSKNVVVLMQRLKCNEFVLLSKGENQLCLKVLKGCCSEPDHTTTEEGNRKRCNKGGLDFKKSKQRLTAERASLFSEQQTPWKAKPPSSVRLSSACHR
eukprot:XP_015135698.1 uncharacterized protein LOC100858941 isoform X3 [Gallus gallus]